MTNEERIAFLEAARLEDGRHIDRLRVLTYLLIGGLVFVTAAGAAICATLDSKINQSSRDLHRLVLARTAEMPSRGHPCTAHRASVPGVERNAAAPATRPFRG
jgi:hypothetical protein